ncbi:DUF6414 family protein [Actinomyces bowdenii]|uniref:DUF6414 family protein n=1 Tax=Actinomyces bowdenii TaxID=131109 RepID=UPI001FB8D896|nr:DUF6414 family protein [Actinomyces bowdenii]
MTKKTTKDDKPNLIKVVYFDEESASDYLDMSAGGKAASTSEDVKERTNQAHGKVEAGLITKLSWLPFFGASGDLNAGAGVAAAGKSILSKTLSNTILTDYLVKSDSDPRVVQLRDLRVTAPKGSMTYMKMFTPYMVLLKLDDVPFDLARMDEVLANAKGYYELLGEYDNGSKCVLRFNLKAFRNNYGLTDLGRMHLVFHGVLVGQTSEQALGMEAEMSGATDCAVVTAAELVDGEDTENDDLLDVYDVILAGVEAEYAK